MSYTSNWANGNAGVLEPARDFVRLGDAQELVDAINRRRLLTYQNVRDFGGLVHSGAAVRAATVATAVEPPINSLRRSLLIDVLRAPLGLLGGDPPTPSAIAWLWPLPDADENKVIIAQGEPSAGQVHLFRRLNGTDTWTDPNLRGGDGARAVHFNELRRVADLLCRGRWTLPVYFVAGMFSAMPDTPWLGGMIANSGAAELSTVGRVSAVAPSPAGVKGLANVTIRDAQLSLTADIACQVEVRHCLRPLDLANDWPTWRNWLPAAPRAWQTLGGLGAQDSTALGAISLPAGTPATLQTPALSSAVAAMTRGAEQNIIVRRTDIGTQTAGVDGAWVVEFELG